jgi:hypothetical protein
VLLYEILSNCYPGDVERESMVKLQAAICQQEPSKAGMRASYPITKGQPGTRPGELVDSTDVF